jgi:predicted RNA-binding protein Jag
MSDGKNLDALDALAQQTYEQIQNGEFVSPREF